MWSFSQGALQQTLEINLYRRDSNPVPDSSEPCVLTTRLTHTVQKSKAPSPSWSVCGSFPWNTKVDKIDHGNRSSIITIAVVDKNWSSMMAITSGSLLPQRSTKIDHWCIDHRHMTLTYRSLMYRSLMYQALTYWSSMMAVNYISEGSVSHINGVWPVFQLKTRERHLRL